MRFVLKMEIGSRVRRLAPLFALFGVGWVLWSCGPTSGGGGQPGLDASWPRPDAHQGNPCIGNPGKTVCDGNTMVLCSDDEKELSRQDCRTLTCLEDKGCVICLPGQTKCQGNQVVTCKADMSGWETAETMRVRLRKGFRA